MMLLQTKGYDSEEHHRFVREDIGGRSIIPLRWEGTPVSRMKGKYRKKLRKYFPKKRYHRRSLVETVNFVAYVSELVLGNVEGTVRYLDSPNLSTISC